MRLILTALGIICLMGLQSCSEDFTVAAPYRQITVVAGVLDRDDTAHYIRIQKAFMDENKSAINMSKEPDSSFYQNLQVKMYRYSADQVNVLDSVTLFRVDLNNEGYVKTDPINDQQFFTSPNYAYKFTNNNWQNPHVLDAVSWYQLVIDNQNTGRKDVSDFVGIVNTDSLRNNDGFYIPEFSLSSYGLNFAKTANNARYKLLSYMPKNGRRAEGYIRFNYVEKDLLSQQKVRKSVSYAFDTEEGVTKGGLTFELSTLNSSIYAFLFSSIGPAPNNIERYMDSCDVFIYAASPEIHYYTTINQGQAGGLTGDNIQPNYTNFTSSDVIGVLGSRGKRVRYNTPIEKATLDSLMNNSATQSLRIRGVSED